MDVSLYESDSFSDVAALDESSLDKETCTMPRCNGDLAFFSFNDFVFVFFTGIIFAVAFRRVEAPPLEQSPPLEREAAASASQAAAKVIPGEAGDCAELLEAGK